MLAALLEAPGLRGAAACIGGRASLIRPGVRAGAAGTGTFGATWAVRSAPATPASAPSLLGGTRYLFAGGEPGLRRRFLSGGAGGFFPGRPLAATFRTFRTLPRSLAGRLLALRFGRLRRPIRPAFAGDLDRYPVLLWVLGNAVARLELADDHIEVLSIGRSGELRRSLTRKRADEVLGGRWGTRGTSGRTGSGTTSPTRTTTTGAGGSRRTTFERRRLLPARLGPLSGASTTGATPTPAWASHPLEPLVQTRG